MAANNKDIDKKFCPNQGIQENKKIVKNSWNYDIRNVKFLCKDVWWMTCKLSIFVGNEKGFNLICYTCRFNTWIKSCDSFKMTDPPRMILVF